MEKEDKIEKKIKELEHILIKNNFTKNNSELVFNEKYKWHVKSSKNVKEINKKIKQDVK